MTLAIIDYGSGNLRSAAKAFERAAAESGLGTSVVVTSDPEQVRKADRIVLPGVGAFADCWRGLNAAEGMVDVLQEQVIQGGKPFMGVCVGMQLMASVGREYKDCTGLGWIPGEVVKMDPEDQSLKIPHMGWNELCVLKKSPVLNGLEDGTHIYFVHSYHYIPENRDHILAEVEYGHKVVAVIGRDNLIGTQFHPEKSQAAGLSLFANFLKWKP
ncbi:imidazole glycerol phosphate synthase subunit HisH [uncultured Kiloniella sp.]|uniref:imidazole glycerol phosphate synthase subunit HisH n=1 Tax=uncultured Kiloniella sp. TaxID=1133091 RepID=UPI0026154A19|nr:imidazole glycerol phosphate synthase subunit HisH [uncultured Kiloniella sp.]